MSSSDPTKPPVKPVLQKPPGYKDPNAPVQPPLKPPRKAVLLPSSRYPKKMKRQRRSCCRTSCCCTFIVTVILVVALLVTGGFFYLWYEPKKPVFHLRSFRFSQFNVSSNGDDGSYLLVVATESRVELKNPNYKLGLCYGSSKVDISVRSNGDEIGLGSKTLPGFTQEKRNVTSLKVATPLTRVVVGDSEGKKIKSEVKNKLLRVTVEVRTKVGVKMDKLRVGSVVVNVKCENVQLKSIQGGFMPKCSIHLWD